MNFIKSSQVDRFKLQQKCAVRHLPPILKNL